MKFKQIFKKKRIATKNSRILSSLLYTIAILLIILGILSFSSIGKVKHIYVSKNPHIQNSQKFKNILLSLKNKQLILLNKSHIYQFVKKQIPNIQNISIHKKYPSSLIIEFDTYPIHFKLSENLYLDSTGTVITHENNETQYPTLIIETQQEIQAMDQLLKQSQVNNLQETLQYFEKKLNLKIQEISYKSIAKEIHLKTPLQTIIWIDTTTDYKAQINKLKNAIPKIDIHKQYYQHIDLRIQSKNAQKIFYKP